MVDGGAGGFLWLALIPTSYISTFELAFNEIMVAGEELQRDNSAGFEVMITCGEI
jgi:hypothetical protein